MIELTNTTAQTLSAGQSITFDNVVVQSGCGECYRKGTGSVKMRFNGTYILAFRGNIGATAATTSVQLSLQLSGTTVPETTMISTTATAGDLNSVSVLIPVRNCCGDYDRVSVVNTGTADVTVGANSVLTVYHKD